MQTKGYVFIVRGIGTPYIRIGTSPDLAQGLRALECRSPYRVQLLCAALVEDMEAGETRRLKLYQPFAKRETWFAIPEELLETWTGEYPWRHAVSSS